MIFTCYKGRKQNKLPHQQCELRGWYIYITFDVTWTMLTFPDGSQLMIILVLSNFKKNMGALICFVSIFTLSCARFSNHFGKTCHKFFRGSTNKIAWLQVPPLYSYIDDSLTPYIGFWSPSTTIRFELFGQLQMEWLAFRMVDANISAMNCHPIWE